MSWIFNEFYAHYELRTFPFPHFPWTDTVLHSASYHSGCLSASSPAPPPSVPGYPAAAPAASSPHRCPLLGCTRLTAPRRKYLVTYIQTLLREIKSQMISLVFLPCVWWGGSHGQVLGAWQDGGLLVACYLTWKGRGRLFCWRGSPCRSAKVRTDP